MAEALYNNLTNTQDAYSAGTQVEMPGETLAERRTRIGGTVGIDVLAELGIDVSQNKKTQLTPEMLDEFEQVISLADMQYTPDWLSNHPRYVRWEVKDPGAKDIEQAREARDDIEQKVHAFIAVLTGKN